MNKLLETSWSQQKLKEVINKHLAMNEILLSLQLTSF